MPETHPAFDAFVATIAALRAPDGCPWDREQTHLSIASHMIEEAYEAVDALEAGDVRHLREELGDVLLQVVLQCQIAADAGEFTIDDVCRDIDEKMIRRHPHVFGDAAAQDANEVLDLWDKVKLTERAAASETASCDASLLESVPKSFPALMQAQKLSRKAASVGFDWQDIDEVRDKVFEEMAELQAAYAAVPTSSDGKVSKEEGGAFVRSVEAELGDALFSMVNVGRKMGLDAEAALRATCEKFRRRWAFMEGAAAGMDIPIDHMDQAQLEELWDAAKLAGL
ncbi:nucleoside triphosphate pyrophosphohydrolase [Adlercreutzia murintestinalis]|uniref:nucleoside triphosphate pyrophosphohydrolase n=1 Tax=Adlercreutzia murintestinalis TaxID=2941325 RepID=UPI00203AE617|nr:nucleoside triphosphate pyrophosphohydrolase [Adlercreutzia murintestinalis]